MVKIEGSMGPLGAVLVRRRSGSKEYKTGEGHETECLKIGEREGRLQFFICISQAN